MITNVLAQLVVVFSTNWISWEGFKLEYESNVTYLNCQVSTVQNSVNYTPWQPKVTFDEKATCPFENRVTASTNSYSRIGEVVKVEKYVFEGGKEMEKSREVVGYVRQEGRKMTREEWQWDVPKPETNKVNRNVYILNGGGVIGIPFGTFTPNGVVTTNH